jgi:hypothetical protein
MTFSINSVDKLEIFNDGGHELIISGVFENGASYKVLIGDFLNDDDAECYSGIPEQGNIIYPELDNTLYVYTPLLNIADSSPYSITVINVDTLETRSILNCLYISNKQFYSKVYTYRNNLFSNYELGPMNITEEN